MFLRMFGILKIDWYILLLEGRSCGVYVPGSSFGGRHARLPVIVICHFPLNISARNGTILSSKVIDGGRKHTIVNNIWPSEYENESEHQKRQWRNKSPRGVYFENICQGPRRN